MNEKKTFSRLLTIKHSHWAVLVVVFLIVGFLGFVFYSNELYNAYVRAYVGPRVQQRFGFKMDRQRMHYQRRQGLDVFVITAVDPTGVLAKAGVRKDEVPVLSFHITDVAFYQMLEQSEKAATEIHLINRDEYQKLLEDGNLVLRDRGHRVLIPKQGD